MLNGSTRHVSSSPSALDVVVVVALSGGLVVDGGVVDCVLGVVVGVTVVVDGVVDCVLGVVVGVVVVVDVDVVLVVGCVVVVVVVVVVEVVVVGTAERYRNKVKVYTER